MTLLEIILFIIGRTQDWKAAVQWYEKALETTPTPSCDLDESAPDEPEYSILAHLAQMYNIGTYDIRMDHTLTIN